MLQEVDQLSRASRTANGVSERDLVALNLRTLDEAPLTDLPGDESAPAFLPDGDARYAFESLALIAL